MNTNGNTDIVTWIVVGFAFWIGWAIVNFIINKVRSRNSQEQLNVQQKPTLNVEEQLAATLGFRGPVTKDEIRNAYRKQLAKYHPDKVHHLGAEFQKMAQEKTREIMSAYEYFQNKYNIT